MIKLSELLFEVIGKSKAIFLAGPAGSGKSYITKQILPSNFTTINVDDTYEELLKASGLGLKQKDFTSDELSQAAKLMGQAQKATREKFAQSSSEKQNLIIDGTGGASKPLLKKKQELEARGYETFMIMIYVSPMTSLKRNAERGRSLPTIAVLKSWQGLVSNIDLYRQEFGNNIVIVNNDPEDVDKSFNPEQIQQLFPMPKGKPKTPEEIAKSKADKEKTNQEIKALLDIEQEFDTFDVAKQKVNQFINE